MVDIYEKMSMYTASFTFYTYIDDILDSCRVVYSRDKNARAENPMYGSRP